MHMDTAAYLQRINYYGSLEPTAATLNALHQAHMLAVPFENLDIHLGRQIVLDERLIYRKIVEQRRGGFCYELNSAFASLLSELGFKVRMLAAEVANPAGGFGPQFDHMTLLVELEERWLADIGFGDGFRQPLRLDTNGAQVQAFGEYRIRADDENRLLQRRNSEGWVPQYRFTLQSHELSDYAEMCRYHQTSPESHFTQKRMCTLATAGGRITLTGTRLITKLGDERQELDLSGDAEVTAVLRERFGITL